MVKVFQINESPEYLLAQIVELDETQFIGFATNKTAFQGMERIAGHVEGLGHKLPYQAQIEWIREKEEGMEFGAKFFKDLLLPEVVLARILAA